MRTVSIDVDAIAAKRNKQARVKRFFGPVFLFLGLVGLCNAWAEQHTLFTDRTVWAVGLALVGAGFLVEARSIFRSNKEPKAVLTILGQFILGVGILGTTALELANKWMGGRAADALLFLLAPLAVGLTVIALYLAVKFASLWFSSLFSRERQAVADGHEADQDARVVR